MVHHKPSFLKIAMIKFITVDVGGNFFTKVSEFCSIVSFWGWSLAYLIWFNPLILLLPPENWNFLVSSASGRPEDVEEALAQYQEAGDKEAAASILSVSHHQHLKCTKIQILTLIFNAPRYQEMKSTSWDLTIPIWVSLQFCTLHLLEMHTTSLHYQLW